MLVLVVLCLVVIDVVIMSVYTGLETSRGGASLVVNRENEITITGVSVCVSVCVDRKEIMRHILHN